MSTYSHSACKAYLAASDLPWIQFALQKESGFTSAKQASEMKDTVLADPRVKTIVADSVSWPEPPLTRHNDAKHPIHKICLLLDFGLDQTDTVIAAICERIMDCQSEDGAFQSLMCIPKVFGGDDTNRMEWMTCDYPTLLYILVKAGYADHRRVSKAAAYLAGLCADNGWRCLSSLPKFRGPGRASDHCPYGNLVALKAFSLLPAYHEEAFIKAAINELLHMWETRGEKKYFLFGIGTDFKKLKFPSLWFEIVHALRVLSHYAYARESKVYSEMLDIVLNKQQPDGGFIPESVYMAYKGWDFGQKKEASPTLTLMIKDIFERHHS